MSEPVSPPEIPWDNLVRFVRQLSHDLRNDLNAIELQAAYLGEIASKDAEMKEEVKRLREMVLKLALALQGLSGGLAQVKPQTIPYGVSDFMEDLRQKAGNDLPKESAELNWKTEAKDETIEIDPQLLQAALLELLRNAFQHGRGQGPVSIDAKIDNGKLQITLREPKTDFKTSTENWGQNPLAKVRHGHYAIGLHRARLIFEAHGGTLQANYDPAASMLVTTVTLPLSPGNK